MAVVPLRAAANSIVCTDDHNALLRQLFNMTPTYVHVVSRSSKQCRTAYARCEQCLHHDLCQVNGTSLIMHLMSDIYTAAAAAVVVGSEVLAIIAY